MRSEPPDWKPSATLSTLRQRAEWMASVRSFFNQRGYLEVETPVMGRCGVTDVYLANIPAYFRGQAYALQTSPEYHMKRLLAAGSGPIFQLSRVFRDDELGRWHNPEFTLLEWYQLDIDHHTLLNEVDGFLQQIAGWAPLVRCPYQQLFEIQCGIDPFTADWQLLKDCVGQFGLSGVLPSDERDCDQYLFLLMSHVIEPALALEPMPIAVYDFPPSQASLAQIKAGRAARFEVYFRGVELANGFHELTDAKRQAERFQLDNHARQVKGYPVAPVDECLLQALEHGLPPCSGVALGIDRLFALVFGLNHIAAGLAFDFSRA